MRELPPGYEPYKPFTYESGDVVVCVRPEDARGWQVYADANDVHGVWTALITLKENVMRVKMPESSARDLMRKLSAAVAEDASRGVRNSLLFRKKE
jgi:hypothetical protein